MTRDALLQKLLASYADSYDVEPQVTEPDRPELVARAHFFVNESRYMISKKAQMYSVNSDEYVWFFSADRLTGDMADACIRYAWERGLSLADHADGRQMVTRVTAVFLCDTMEEAAAACITRCRLYKSFQFSLKGWMECHTAAADLGKESAVSNRYGKSTAEHLKNLMHPVPRRRPMGERLLRRLFRH